MKEAHDRKVALFMGQEAEREQEEAGIKHNLQSHGVNDLLPPTVCTVYFRPSQPRQVINPQRDASLISSEPSPSNTQSSSVAGQ